MDDSGGFDGRTGRDKVGYIENTHRRSTTRKRAVTRMG